MAEAEAWVPPSPFRPPTTVSEFAIPIAAGAAGASVLLHLLAAAMLRQFSPWRENSVEGVHVNANRIVSSAHALVAVAGGVLALSSDTEGGIHLFADPLSSVFSRSPLRESFMLISAGYLAYDAAALLLIAGLRADRYLLAHHAIVLAGVAFGVAFGVGELHMAAISLNEASSPCLHARNALHDAGLTGSRLYACNGLAFAAAFLLFRIVVLLLLVVQVAWCWVALLPAWWPLASGSERAVLLALTLLLAGHTLVNFYWFSRIMAHVGRHVRLARRPSPAESPPRRAPPAAGAAHALDRSQMRVRRRREVGQGATKVKGAGGGNET